MYEDGCIFVMFVFVMNSFFLKMSLDVSSRMILFYESVVLYFLWVFKGNVCDKCLKEELIKYCYLYVNLDVVSDGGVEFFVELFAR